MLYLGKVHCFLPLLKLTWDPVFSRSQLPFLPEASSLFAFDATSILWLLIIPPQQPHISRSGVLLSFYIVTGILPTATLFHLCLVPTAELKLYALIYVKARVINVCSNTLKFNPTIGTTHATKQHSLNCGHTPKRAGYASRHERLLERAEDDCPDISDVVTIGPAPALIPLQLGLISKHLQSLNRLIATAHWPIILGALVDLQGQYVYIAHEINNAEGLDKTEAWERDSFHLISSCATC